MITEEDVEAALREIIKDNPKIPYTMHGMDFIYNELYKYFPERGYYISTESISVEDRAQRRLPRITIKYY